MLLLLLPLGLRATAAATAGLQTRSMGSVGNTISTQTDVEAAAHLASTADSSGPTGDVGTEVAPPKHPGGAEGHSSRPNRVEPEEEEALARGGKEGPKTPRGLPPPDAATLIASATIPRRCGGEGRGGGGYGPSRAGRGERGQALRAAALLHGPPKPNSHEHMNT